MYQQELPNYSYDVLSIQQIYQMNQEQTHTKIIVTLKKIVEPSIIIIKTK